jgi:hypothetical protein
MQPNLLFTSLCLLFLGVQTFGQQPPSVGSSTAFKDIDLIFSFQGKGSLIMYDGGLIAGAYEMVPALKSQRVVCSGNSSGSMWAAYFAYHGFNDRSIGKLSSYAKMVDVSKIRQNESLAYVLQQKLNKEKVEMEPMALVEAIAIALGVSDWRDCRSIMDVARKSQWRPNYPFLVVAANLDVLGNANETTTPYVDRVFDYDNYEVTWSNHAFRRYSGDPKAFEKMKPLVSWNNEMRIGKAATYFCDRATFDLLSQMQQVERLADLRLVETPVDALMALVASTAEPTYFAPVEEWDYSKLDVGHGFGNRANIRRRVYAGGFVAPVVAQDLRRMLPRAHVLGTQWSGLDMLARAYMDKRWGLDAELMHYKANWWLDAELRPSAAVHRLVQSRKLDPHQEFQLGLETARRELASGGKPPQYAIAGRLAWHPSNALFSDASEKPHNITAHRTLKQSLKNIE